MPRYTYTARTSSGERRSGSVEAPNRASAVAQVERLGAVPVTLKEAARGGPSPPPSGARTSGTPKTGRARMRRRDVLQLTRELSDLLASGMTLGDALHTLAGRPGGRGRVVVEAVRDAIVRGESLSAALAEWPAIFPSLYVSMIRAGEVSGTLDTSLDRLAAHYERVQEAREKVVAALVYPGIVFSIGLLTIAFIMMYVVPRFAAMFQELGSVLPLPTRILIGLADGLSGWRGIVVVAVLVGTGWAVHRLIKTPSGRRIWHGLLLRIPGIRGITASSAFSHFAETLASLLQNGVPVLDALRIVEGTMGNVVIAAELREARERVTDGSTISRPLAAGRIFPLMLTDMLAVGERTGDMSGALEHIARRYRTELDRNVKVFITVLEPLLIVFVAGAVGFVAISMLLAVFDLTSGLNL